MIISGNKIARAIRNELREELEEKNAACETLDVSRVSHAVHIFIVGVDEVIENFVMKKKQFAQYLGIDFIEHRFDASITQNELLMEIDKVNKQCSKCPRSLLGQKRGIVVQLPLPSKIDTQIILNSVQAEFDIDGLGSDTKFIEPVAGAVQEILERKNIEVHGKKVLVVGRGKLVGEPVAKLLNKLGAIVTVVDKSTDISELTKLCKESDVIVSGAGVPNLIIPDMISEGVALLDAGTSTRAGSVVGDIAYECKDKAKYFARTPGGIGPVTVAVLFKNLILGKHNM